MIGAIRLCQGQGVAPVRLIRAVANVCVSNYGDGMEDIAGELQTTWTDAPEEEVKTLIHRICGDLPKRRL